MTGRPVPRHLRRAANVNIKLTDYEKDQLFEKAYAAGFATMSEYVRNLAGLKPVRDSDSDSQG